MQLQRGIPLKSEHLINELNAGRIKAEGLAPEQVKQIKGDISKLRRTMNSRQERLKVNPEYSYNYYTEQNINYRRRFGSYYTLRGKTNKELINDLNQLNYEVSRYSSSITGLKEHRLQSNQGAREKLESYLENPKAYHEDMTDEEAQRIQKQSKNPKVQQALNDENLGELFRLYNDFIESKYAGAIQYVKVMLNYIEMRIGLKSVDGEDGLKEFQQWLKDNTIYEVDDDFKVSIDPAYSGAIDKREAKAKSEKIRKKASKKTTSKKPRAIKGLESEEIK